MTAAAPTASVGATAGGADAGGRRPSAAQLLALDLVAVMTAALAGVFTPPSQPLRLSGTGWHVLAGVVWVLVSLGVLARRRAPLPALVVVVVAAGVGLVIRSPAPADYYLALAVYTVAATSGRRRGVRAVVVAVVVDVAGLAVGGGRLVTVAAIGGTVTIAVGWLVGESVRISRGQARRFAALQAEQAAIVLTEHRHEVARAVAAQRVQLARELHDIVAHGMSLVAVRAGVARVVMDSQPGQAKEALDIIETTTRQTLHEMRLLVGVLRTDNEQPQADLGPAPGLDDISRLVAEAQLAGMTVELSVTGPPRQVYPAVGLSAYRIVGEALTNVVRHAGPTRVRVTVDYRPGELQLEICDDGPSGHRPPEAQITGRDGILGGGYGLLGIGERAALFGGRATAGPHGGGFRVQVTLPTDDLITADPATDHSTTPATAATATAITVGGPGGAGTFQRHDLLR